MRVIYRSISPGVVVLYSSFLLLVLLTTAPLTNADMPGKSAMCNSCHGKDGVSTKNDVPSIAGVSPLILEEYMLQYQDEARPCRALNYGIDMCAIAKTLSEDGITELAEYYGGQEFVAATQEFDAAKAVVGEKIHKRTCEICHSDGGSFAGDDAGILAGQWMPYLEQVFADYAAGERGMMEDKMKEKIDALDAESITALIHYYASMQ